MNLLGVSRPNPSITFLTPFLFRAGVWSGICAGALLGVPGMAGSSTAAGLPAGLSSPDHGVVCDGRRGVCFDRFGPSIGLTEAFLGPDAARADCRPAQDGARSLPWRAVLAQRQYIVPP